MDGFSVFLCVIAVIILWIRDKTKEKSKFQKADEIIREQKEQEQKLLEGYEQYVYEKYGLIFDPKTMEYKKDRNKRK